MTEQTYNQAKELIRKIDIINQFINKLNELENGEEIAFTYTNNEVSSISCTEIEIINKVKTLLLNEYTTILNSLQTQFDNL